jgi:toxin ParE1/3/4
MTAKYRISAKAMDDLERIWLYTYNTWSKAQADRYYQLLIDEIIHVSNHFDMATNAAHIRKGYRSAKVKSHVIYFRTDAKNIVEVVRVLHEKMDKKNYLE